MKDGWNEFEGYDIYVEDGKVLRGTKKEGLGEVTVYPYKTCKSGGWDNASGVSLKTFKRGFKDGKYILS